MVELKEGTFLVLEIAREYENSGNYTRVQGKYQGKPRRGIWEGYGLLATLGNIGSVLVRRCCDMIDQFGDLVKVFFKVLCAFLKFYACVFFWSFTCVFLEVS